MNCASHSHTIAEWVAWIHCNNEYLYLLVYIYIHIHVWVKIIVPYVLMSAGICKSIWPYLNVFLDNMLSRSEYDQLTIL